MPYIFPNLSWDFVYINNYVTFYLLVPLLTLFFQTAFKIKKFKWVFNFIYIFSGIYLLTVFLLPSLIYTKILFIYQIFTLLVIIFSIYLVINAWKNKKHGAKLFLFSFLFLVACGINDMLLYNNIIDSIVLTPLGSLLLIWDNLWRLRESSPKLLRILKTSVEQLGLSKSTLQELEIERDKRIRSKKKNAFGRKWDCKCKKKNACSAWIEFRTNRRTGLLGKEHNPILINRIRL